MYVRGGRETGWLILVNRIRLNILDFAAFNKGTVLLVYQCILDDFF